MSREQSDGEDSIVETEVRLPRGSDPGPDQMPKDMPVVMGAVGAEADTRDLGQTHRLGPLSGAKPKRPRFELPIQQTPGPRRLPPCAGTQPVKPVTDRFAFEMPTPTYPGPGRQLPGSGTPPVLDRLGDDLSDMPNSMHDKLPPRAQLGHQRPG